MRIKYWCDIDDCYVGGWSLKALFMRLFCHQDRRELEYQFWKIRRMSWVYIFKIYKKYQKLNYHRYKYKSPLNFWNAQALFDEEERKIKRYVSNQNTEGIPKK